MKPKILFKILIICGLWSFNAFGQNGLNYIDWVNPAQTYLEIKVGKEGIYRLNADFLQANFPNAGSLNASGFQIFRRGREVAILVSAGTDNLLNGNDYIDFYGKTNDASIELEMYQRPLKVYNPYQSNYDDTAHYFLTHTATLNGKRVVNNGLVNNTNVPFEVYGFRDAMQNNRRKYNLGVGFRGNATFSSLNGESEGWTGQEFSVGFGNVVGAIGGFNHIQINGISNVYINGPKPTLEIVHVGNRFLQHPLSLYLGTIQSLISDTLKLVDYEAKRHFFSFEPTLFDGAALNLWSLAKGSANLRQMYARVRYPATFQMPNGFIQVSMDLLPNPNNYSRLKLENLGAVPEVYDISDPFNCIRVGAGFINGAYIAGVENTAVSRRICIQNQPFIVNSAGISACSFSQIQASVYDYLMVYHPNLRKPAGGFSDPVLAYYDYRKSVSGGAYQPLLVDIKEVYQRFGYGDRTPLAIHNLVAYFVQQQANPKALLLMGKGLSLNNAPNQGIYHSINLIPTFGVPGSDNLFALGLLGTSNKMAMAVGRIAATSAGQLATYLKKVIDHEAFQYDDLWKKNVFHISGGKTPNEQTSFTMLMRNILTERIKGKYYGANVSHYNKNTNAIVQPIDVRKIVNNGVALMNLFGHASEYTSDVDIGFATDPALGLNNVGKYPVIIINGCFTGNLFINETSLNENWVFAPDKGAIAFLGTSDEGFSGLLWRHMEVYYQKSFQDSALFGSSLGHIQGEAIQEYLKNLGTNPQLDSAFMHQFVVHGDPVIPIFGAKKPDYKTSNAEVFIATPNANAASPELRIGVIASNFGRYNGDSVRIGIRRRFGDGQFFNYYFKVRPLPNKDTFYLSLPQTGTHVYAGTNRIEATLDNFNFVDEIRENNNTGTLEFFLPTSGIIPLFPKKYNIVSNRNVRLTVQTSNLLAGSRRFIFQVDTSAGFNSALFFQSAPITAGNICTWTPLLPLDKDSLVYYWRVRFADQLTISDTTWYKSSFEYIKNSPTGWAQSHFYQFGESEDVGVEKDYFFRKWNFPTITKGFEIKVSGGSKQGAQFYQCLLDGISIFNGTEITSDCFKPGSPRVGAIHFDRCSLTPQHWNYSKDPDGYFATGCGRLPYLINIFAYDPNYPTLKAYFSSYMQEQVKEGDYVLLFSLDSLGRMDTVKKYLAPHMATIGLHPDSLLTLGNGNPFIIFGQKLSQPATSGAVFVAARNPSIPKNRQTLELKKNMSSSCSFGVITSSKIGPASKWYKVYNRMGNIEIPVKDEYFLQLVGINLAGKDSVLVSNISQFPFDIEFVNPDSFPYLQLRAFLKDTANFTPATIKRWMVMYDGVPEGVINTSFFPVGEYQNKNLPEGDSVGYRFAFTNISQKAFKDSVKVHFSLNGSLHSVKNLGLIPPDSTVQFQFDKIGTLGRPSQNNLLAFVNPRLQPEEYYENNALNLAFQVVQDKVQPVLDVTFDGVKIMNGDFVAPTPLISVSLKDENKFLIKSDTTGITLLLTRPCQGCVPERIPLNSPQVKVFPAGKDNMFRLEYRPEKLENGSYRLAVQGTDVKGNESGSKSYQVDFKVLDQNTITNFYPYPNPFSTSCQWVFTLTGQIPDDFKIQIMTVTGRVVREIMKNELGPLRIGNNTSSFRWNATDEYGDRLANGVYLYRVVMKEGSAYAHRETGGDFTFTKGFGKLYIIR